MTFLQAIVSALRSVIFLMECMILIRVLCELFVIKRDSAAIKFVIRVTEPLLLPVRTVMARSMHGRKQRFDLSPFVVMLILLIISRLLK